ncbi:hypothetical protein CsSME_00042517 [Camellia sinensis var. sinensis]
MPISLVLFSSNRRDGPKWLKYERSKKEEDERSQDDQSYQQGVQHDRNENDRRPTRFGRHSRECFNCGEIGHYTKDCRLKRRPVEGNVVTSNGYHDENRKTKLLRRRA